MWTKALRERLQDFGWLEDKSNEAARFDDLRLGKGSGRLPAHFRDAHVKTRRRLFSESLVFMFFLFALSAFGAAQDQPPSANHRWLNGKWVGQSAIGEEMELTLQVVERNQVKGWGRIRQARRPIIYRTIVNGTVNDGEVKLVSYNPFSRITTQFLLSLVDGALTGRGFSPDDTEGVEVTFTKLD
jgi:hypothetical protein